MKELIVDEFLYRTIVVTENGSPILIRVSDTRRNIAAGDIYLAVVKNVTSDRKMAFLDIGSQKQAFLRSDERIEVGVGDSVLVEVLKGEEDRKGARVTLDWSLAEGSVVIRNGKGISFSRNFPREEMDRFRSLIPEPIGYNVLLRSSAVREDLKVLLDTMDRLKEEFLSIGNRQNSVKGPALLYRREDELKRIMDHFQKDFIDIVTNSVDAADNMAKSVDRKRITVIEDSPINAKNLRNSIDKLRNSRVQLPSGGNIVIEETEAMTTVDVNVAGGTIRGVKEVRNTNSEALEELARQLELRNISGVIIVDFIDMEEERYREDLYLKAKELFQKSSVRCIPYPLTELSLMQITRRKESSSLSETIFSGSRHMRMDVSRDYLMEVIYERLRKLDRESDGITSGIILTIAPQYENPAFTEALKEMVSEFPSLQVETVYRNTVDTYKIERTIV